MGAGEEEPRGLSGSRASVCAGEEFRQGTGGSRFGGSLRRHFLKPVCPEAHCGAGSGLSEGCTFLGGGRLQEEA